MDIAKTSPIPSSSFLDSRAIEYRSTQTSRKQRGSNIQKSGENISRSISTKSFKMNRSTAAKAIALFAMSRASTSFLSNLGKLHAKETIPLPKNARVINQKNLTAKEQFFQDIDLSKPNGYCGYYKCFFPTKDPKVGWLIANDREPNKVGLRFNLTPPLLSTTWDAGWKMASELEDKYDIRHFLLEAPKVIDPNGLNPLEKEKLNSAIVKRAHLDNPQGTINHEGALLGQKVRVAPHPHIELRTENKRFKHENKLHKRDVKSLDDLLNSVPKEKLDSFKAQFKKDIDVVFEILEEKPFFAEDFQIIVDNKGRVHHTDMDGHFNLYHWSPTPRRKSHSKVMVEHVQSYLNYWVKYVDTKVLELQTNTP